MLMVYQRSVINTGGGLEVFSVADGRPLWTGPGYAQRFGLFGTGGLIWPGAEVRPERSFVWSPEEITRVGLDPETGKLVRSVSVERLITPGHHYRCYPAKATERFILLPKRGVEFLDMTLPVDLEPIWETRIGGRITPPVVADRRLFVAGEDSHTVYC